MTRTREQLIRRLAAEAARPAPYRSVTVRALQWTLAATFATVLLMTLREPFSGAVLAGLTTAPGAALAPLLGVLVALTAAVAAFRSGVPAPVSPARCALWPMLLAVGWVVLLAYMMQRPSVGALHVVRAHCWVEVFGVAAPGMLLGFGALRRLWPLHGGWSGALLGLSAGAIAAVAMDLACDPGARHSLSFHLAPAIALAVVGALLGRHLLHAQ